MRKFNGLFGIKVEEEKPRAFGRESVLLTMFGDRPIIQTMTVKLFF